MHTIDIHPELGLALVQDTDNWSGENNNTRYVPCADAPPLSDVDIPQTYLGQLHYVASHIPVFLQVHQRVMPNGQAYPKGGWTRWRNW